MRGDLLVILGVSSNIFVGGEEMNCMGLGFTDDSGFSTTIVLEHASMHEICGLRFAVV